MTLQRYLTRLIGLCVLPVLALAIGLSYRQFDDAREGETARAERLAQRLANDVDQMLGARWRALQMLERSPALDDPARWSEFHPEATGFRDAFGGQVILVADGKTVLHSEVAWGAEPPPLPRPDGRAAESVALQTGQPAVGDPFTGPLARESLVALAWPVARGKARSMVLVNTVPLRTFETLLDQAALPAHWQARLGDARGRAILARGGAAEGAKAAEAANGPDRPDRPAVRVTARPLSVPWVVEVAIPRQTYVQRLAGLGAWLAVALLAVVAISLTVGRRGTRRLAASVRSLVDLSTAQHHAGEIQEIDEARRMLDETLREREATAQALRLREEQLRRTFESASDAIVAADANQIIVMANPAAAQVFQRSVEELVGAPLDVLVPERFRAVHRQHVQRFGHQESATRAMGAERPDVVGLRADGREFPLEASISQAHVGEQRLYTVILRDVTERRRLEAELRNSHADLARLVIAQQTVEEGERKRISRELHDELQQVLAAIKMDVGAMEAALGGDAARLAPLIGRIDSLATAAITSSRRIVNDLRPQLLEELGLVPALELLAHQFTERTGVVATVDATHGHREAPPDGLQDELPDAVALCLYRVAQEALNNVAKHAAARHVRVVVETHAPGGCTLRVSDDGRGLQPADHQKLGSFGLRGMAERVRALGGTLRIEAAPGQGVTVIVEIGEQRFPQNSTG